MPDVDSLTERAEAADAEILQPPKDILHGDRTVILKDPSGHIWVLLTHLEDVSQEELRRRNGTASSDWPAQSAAGGRVREAERVEPERLRQEMSEKNKRVRELEMERDVLKRDMALWVK